MKVRYKVQVLNNGLLSTGGAADAGGGMNVFL